MRCAKGNPPRNDARRAPDQPNAGDLMMLLAETPWLSIGDLATDIVRRLTLSRQWDPNDPPDLFQWADLQEHLKNLEI